MSTDAAELQELKDQIFWQERDLRKMREELAQKDQDIYELKWQLESMNYRLRRLEDEFM